MFKQVFSALLVSSVMAGGTAFAADQTAAGTQTATTPAVSASTGTTATAKPTVAQKHHKVVHKVETGKKGDTSAASSSTGGTEPTSATAK